MHLLNQTNERFYKLIDYLAEIVNQEGHRTVTLCIISFLAGSAWTLLFVVAICLVIG